MANLARFYLLIFNNFSQNKLLVAEFLVFIFRFGRILSAKKNNLVYS